MVKITDKVAAHKAANPNTPFFSFEYFPPKTEAGVQNLYARIEKMAAYEPMWVDVTWGAGGSTSNTTQELCENFGAFSGLDVLMHLTCTNVTAAETREVLEWCKAKGICNILALRGDPPKDAAWTATEGGFQNAVDLVRFMRQEFGDYFCIGVAAYPEGHMDAPSKDADFQYFVEKVQAGADFAVTQLFYDTSLYFKFCERCKAAGVTIDIFPGLMPIQSYGGFKRMTGFCKTIVPQAITDALEPIQNDDQAVREYGIQLGVEMGRELLAGGCPGLHLYTLNLETATLAIVNRLGLVDEVKAKSYPWMRPADQTTRSSEAVRPIFWSQRSRSYVARTRAWDDFPNGRFGNRDSPAFGEFDYHLYRQQVTIKDAQKKQWAFETLQDLEQVFRKFVSREGVTSLPWCPASPGDETVCIKKQLVRLNDMGCLTINSQPRVNGAPSNDPMFGWGPKDGAVYQKAYVEFFCPPRRLEQLEKAVAKNPQLEFIAAQQNGKVVKSFAETSRTTAVTWGIFPGQEVQQPTVVDSQSFLAWKDEAFALWAEFEQAVEADEPKRLLQEIRDDWYLVSIVDNNFLSGDMFETLLALDQGDEVFKSRGA